MSSLIKLVLLVLFIFIFVLPQYSYAYINPGIGSCIFQTIIAVLVTGLFFIKSIFKAIKRFFVNLFSKNKKDFEK